MNPRVLLIDFTPRSLSSTANMLEAEGFEVISAGLAQEVDAALQTMRFDAAVVEPVLPGTDGFEICRNIKRKGGAGGPSVIVASRVFRGPRLKKMSREASADAFIERPQQDHLLVATLRKLLPEPLASQASPSAAALTTGGSLSSGAHSLESQSAPHQVHPAAHISAPRPRLEAAPAAPPTRMAAPAVAPAKPSAPVTQKAPAQPASREQRPAATGSAKPGNTAQAPPPPRTPAVSQSPAPTFAGLGEISDDDIDGALSWMTGTTGDEDADVFGEAEAIPAPKPAAPRAPVAAADPVVHAPIPAPSPPTATPARRGSPSDDGFLAELRALPLDFGFDEASPSSAEDHAAESALAHTRFPDDEIAGLSASIDAANVLDSPAAFGPTGSSLPPEMPESDVEFEFLAEREIAAATPPALAGDVQVDLDLPLDLEAADTGYSGPRIETAAAEESDSVVEDAPQELAPPRARSMSRDALDDMLDRAFAGYAAAEAIPPDEDPRYEPAAVAGASPPAKHGYRGEDSPLPGLEEGEIPDGLRGMDAGTADLLSTLAELEDSIPNGVGSMVRNGGGSPFSDRPEAPPLSHSDDELTLDEIFSKRVGDVDAPRRGGEASPPAARDEQPTSVELAAAGPSETGPRSRGRWFLAACGFALGVAALGVGGSILLRGDLEASVSPPSAAIAGLDSAPAREDAVDEKTPVLAEPVPDPQTAAAQQVEASRLASVRRPVSRDRDSREESAPPQEPTVPSSTPPVIARTAPPASRNPPLPGTALERSRETPRPASATEAASDGDRPTRPSPVEAAEVIRRSQSSPLDPADNAPDSALATEPIPTARLGDEKLPAVPSDSASEPIVEAEPLLLVKLGDLDEPLQRVEAPLPTLTSAANAAGMRERAFVNVLVGPDGNVLDARVMMDPGYGLGDAARRATLQWRYTAPRFQGRRAQVWKTEPVEFLRP